MTRVSDDMIARRVEQKLGALLNGVPHDAVVMLIRTVFTSFNELTSEIASRERDDEITHRNTLREARVAGRVVTREKLWGVDPSELL